MSESSELNAIAVLRLVAMRTRSTWRERTLLFGNYRRAKAQKTPKRDSGGQIQETQKSLCRQSEVQNDTQNGEISRYLSRLRTELSHTRHSFKTRQLRESSLTEGYIAMFSLGNSPDRALQFTPI